MTNVTAGNIAKQKIEFITILDSVKAANMNAVFFQVRPETDAFYNSAYEPWSAHLGGVRGTNPGYDPLAFTIDESHKRGIELHAWLNPYRFETSAKKYAGAVCDNKALQPGWILDYTIYNVDGSKKTDGITILDPGNPGVRKLIKNVVGDLLSKYDLDGVIFDDYFYAYAGTSTTLDSYSQGLYKPAGMTLSNWRRDNVNKMVADVYDTIQAVKPQVIFGVSPFGIWTTQTAVATARGLTLPSGITGSDMYEQIYCDPVAWLQQGKVDYISPQLYWTTTSTGQDYKKLCPWWSDVAYKFNKYFYSSMSVSSLISTYQAPSAKTAIPERVFPADLGELKLYTGNGGLPTGLTRTEQRVSQALEFADSEVGLEIDWNRTSTKNEAPGTVLYSIKNLVTNGKFTKYLRKQKFTSPALTPAVNWKTHPTLPTPTNIRLNGNLLSWSSTDSNIRFTIYAVPNDQVGVASSFTNVLNLLGVSYSNQFDLSRYTGLFATNTFAVGAMDRYGNEFTPAYVSTSLENVFSNIKYSVSNNKLFIQLDNSSTVEIYSINGVMIEKKLCKGTFEKELVHGVYLLRVNGVVNKIVI
ncbi:MAG: family 10 glycosylhydrolase [Paludibacter sp.]|nr:family 10 glycosylhydrolase [Paludibacter sp.]